MNTFLPEGYEQPVSEGNYFRFKLGENRFRILSSAITGFEYWTKDKKPVRSKTPFEERPEDMQVDGQVKHFWAFVVWNYEAKKPQIMEITQTTIMNGIGAYTDNHKWGDPSKYDFVVKASGDGLEREYQVMAEPHSEAPKADISKINLQALYSGADPFSQDKVDYPTEEAEDIPF